MTPTTLTNKQKPSTLQAPIFPAWLGIVILLLVASSLVLTAFYRVSGIVDADSALQDRGERVAERQLFFKDIPNGDVAVVDAVQELPITTLTTGEDGFMRSVMRGFARERKASGLGQEIPFRLTVWQNGSVSLIDPATGRVVELSAFGPDNVGAFTRLLEGNS